MKRIISSNIKVALWPGGGMLEDNYWKQLEEGLWGTRSKYRSKEDSGSPRKNEMIFPGMGSRWRANNPGAGVGTGYEKEEEKKTGIGSGYNDGEAARDQDAAEQGPGHSPKLPEPYTGLQNELFLDLAIKGGTESGFRDKQIRDHLKRIMNQKPAITHQRYNVDATLN